MLKLTKEEQVFLQGFRAGICHIGSPLADWPDADLWSIGADHQYHRQFGSSDGADMYEVPYNPNVGVPTRGVSADLNPVEVSAVANQMNADTGEQTLQNVEKRKRGRPAKNSA